MFEIQRESRRVILKEIIQRALFQVQGTFEADWYSLVVNSRLQQGETHYNCVSLSFSRMKSTISAPSTEAETVRDARNECNDVPWLR